MNITRAEFERLLPAAVGHAPVTREGDTYSGGGDAGRWCIRFGAAEPLAIGHLRIVLHEVAIELAGFDPDSEAAFLRRFDLYFQKGGG
jgi:hypothetical protein